MNATLRIDFGVGFLALFVALGCRNESPEGIAPSASRDIASGHVDAPSLPTPGPSEKPRPTPLEELERITEEDYEEEAIVDISKDTLDAELDRLEREIGD